MLSLGGPTFWRKKNCCTGNKVLFYAWLRRNLRSNNRLFVISERGSRSKRSRSRSRDRTRKRSRSRSRDRNSRAHRKRSRSRDREQRYEKDRKSGGSGIKSGGGGKDELSVEETNKIRASLGLAPLKWFLCLEKEYFNKMCLSTPSLISPSFLGGPTIFHKGNFLTHTSHSKNL